MIQRFSLSPSVSPLLSLFIYFTRLTAFSPAISCYPPSTLTLCSLPETFTVATTLETSWSKRGKGGGRVTYPEQLSLADFQHVDREGSIGLAYNATDSRYRRLRSEFFYRYSVYFPLFSGKYFPGLYIIISGGINILVFFLFTTFDEILRLARFACHFHSLIKSRFCQYNMLHQIE